jgi:D-amino-acid oxidase
MPVNVNNVAPRQIEVVVVGAGVSGLTTAVCVAEAGYAVRVLATRRPKETTSCAAGALWGPYLVRDDRVLEWCERSRRVLEALAGPQTGVQIVAGVEAARTTMDAPQWATLLDGFAVCDEAELPPGYVTGWRYKAPIVDMPTYLDYLVGRLAMAGGQIVLGSIGSLAEAATLAPVVVNCAGYGARTLVPDPTVTPIRGQLLVVDNPGIDRFFAEAEADHDATDLTYIFPQGDHVVLGGTAHPGHTDLTPDSRSAKEILRRCAAVEPALAGATVRRIRVGVRPSRSRVRLESVDVGGSQVIHNYGHGGSGVTLSWGCAADVLRLVRASEGPGPVPHAAPGPEGVAVLRD